MLSPEQAAAQLRATRQQVKAGLDAVHADIEAACQTAGRSPDEIALIAVTKYAPIEAVEALADLGHLDMGENYTQNLADRVTHMDAYTQRQAELLGKTPEDIRWHMIGHLQRNKVKQVAPNCSLIHGVDTLRLAKEISAWGQKKQCDVHVLVQVNASNEDSKFGCPPAAATALASELLRLPNLNLRGFMTMAAPNTDPNPCFAHTKELFDEVLESEQADPEHFNLLSMGMSNDFKDAIQHGSNVLRIGSAIFGELQG